MKPKIKVGAEWMIQVYSTMRDVLIANEHRIDESGTIHLPSKVNGKIVSLGDILYLRNGLTRPFWNKLSIQIPYEQDWIESLRNFGLLRRSDDPEGAYGDDGIRNSSHRHRAPRPDEWLVPDIEIQGVDYSLAPFITKPRPNPNVERPKKVMPSSPKTKKNNPSLEELIDILGQEIFRRGNDKLPSKSRLHQAKECIDDLSRNIQFLLENYDEISRALDLKEEA